MKRLLLRTKYRSFVYSSRKFIQSATFLPPAYLVCGKVMFLVCLSVNGMGLSWPGVYSWSGLGGYPWSCPEGVKGGTCMPRTTPGFDSLHRGRYASCGPAGGLSCGSLLLYLLSLCKFQMWRIPRVQLTDPYFRLRCLAMCRQEVNSFWNMTITWNWK